MATAKEVSNLKDNKEGDKIRLYVAAALILLLLAVVSSVITDFTARPGACNSIFQQQNYNCIEQAAYSTSNSSMCSKLPTYYSQQCYTAIAENTKNQALCAGAGDPNMSAQCTTYIANATNNPGMCNSLGESSQSVCVDEIAFNKNMPSICLQLENGSNRQSCLAGIDLSNAVSHTNSSYCAAITSNNDSNVTFAAFKISGLASNFAYFNISQILYYSVLSGSQIGARDMCYMSLAYGSSNQTYCAGVSNSLQQVCTVTATHFNTAASSNSVASVNNTQFMQECDAEGNPLLCNETSIYLTAINTANTSECAKLPTQFSYQCYYSIAESKNQTGYCSYIKNATLNNQCIISISTGYLNNPNNT